MFSVKEIAKEIGCSESTTRREIEEWGAYLQSFDMGDGTFKYSEESLETLSLVRQLRKEKKKSVEIEARLGEDCRYIDADRAGLIVDEPQVPQIQTSDFLSVFVQMLDLVKKPVALPPAPAPQGAMDWKGASAYTGYSAWRLKQLVRDKQVPHIKQFGKVLFIPASLDKWLQQLESETMNEL